MIDQRQCLDRKGGGDIAVADGEKVVAVLMVAPFGKVGRAAIYHRIGPVEATDHEFVMDLMLNQ